MGDITKTITIKVPSKIIYNIYKESIIANVAYMYCKDLIKWDLTDKYSITRDVPDKIISAETGKWGAKVTIDLFLKEIDDKTTEVTLHLGYFLVLGVSARQGMISMVEQMITLEKGYIAGISKDTRDIPKD